MCINCSGPMDTVYIRQGRLHEFSTVYQSPGHPNRQEICGRHLNIAPFSSSSHPPAPKTNTLGGGQINGAVDYPTLIWHVVIMEVEYLHSLYFSKGASIKYVRAEGEGGMPKRDVVLELSKGG